MPLRKRAIPYKEQRAFYLPTTKGSQKNKMTKEDIEFVKKCLKENKHRFYVWGKWKGKRKEILKADRHECQVCKSKGIHARANTVHHIKFLDKFPELALENNYFFQGKEYRNLISVCRDCHEELHGHRRKNKKEKPLTEEKW